MNAQISLELLLYLSIAGISLLYSATTLYGSLPKIEGILTRYSIAAFVNQVNSNLIDGKRFMTLYLPRGLCNSTFNGEYLQTKSGSFSLLDRINGSAGIFCPDGVLATFSLAYNPNGYDYEMIRLGSN